MCDLVTINNAMLRIDEPSALFWNGPNCTGIQMSLQQGDYSTLDGRRIGNDSISGMWVPPNMELDVFDNVNFQTPLGTYKPGVLYADLDNPNIGAGKKQISSLKLRRTSSWTDHLAACCTGKVANGATPETCGQWWGKGQDANGVCDDIMEAYCDPTGSNADSPKCSCYSVPDSPNDSLDVKLLKAQPKCWSATCSTKGYLPSNMTNSTCPNVKICRQDFAIPGSQNIMENNQYIQDCSETIIPPAITNTGQVLNPQDSVPPDSSNTNSGSGSGTNPDNIVNKYPPITNSNDSSLNYSYLYIFLTFLFVVIAFLSYRRYKENNTNENGNSNVAINTNGNQY